jgi:hypothetical protein
MSKLSLEALKERAEAVASEELLNSISGGTENSCHDDEPTERHPLNEQYDETGGRNPLSPLGQAIVDWLWN